MFWFLKTYANVKNRDLWTYQIFFSDENSKIRSYNNLTNSDIKTFLNELFTLDRERNEQLMNEYIRQKQINMTWPQRLTLTN